MAERPIIEKYDGINITEPELAYITYRVFFRRLNVAKAVGETFL